MSNGSRFAPMFEGYSQRNNNEYLILILGTYYEKIYLVYCTGRITAVPGMFLVKILRGTRLKF